MFDNLESISACRLAERMGQRELSPVEVTDYFLDRIERFNAPINAFVTVLVDDARCRAREAEQALMRGDAVGPLHGIPVAIKDLFDFKAGVRNTFGCRPLADFIPPASANYVERLEQAGAVIIGKTNTAEMGHKGITDNDLHGPTSTPFDTTRNAGGSSGGSAAAVAAGLVPLAQGSDAGGSIRIPASFCGVYGYKASYGRVPMVTRPNAFLCHTPFVHAGPITRHVEDAALMLNVMAGPDPRDPLCLPDDGVDYRDAIGRGIEGKRVAFSPNFGVFAVEASVAALVADAVGAFEEAGARVETVDVKIRQLQQELADLWLRQMGVLYVDVMELFKHAGIDLMADHRDELSPQLIDLVELGHAQSARCHMKDDWLRTEVCDAIEDVLTQHDLLVTPTLGVPPVPNARDGQTLGPIEVDGRPTEPCIGWCLTHPVNFAGNPAASAPAGLTADNLPVGMQIIGRRFADVDVLAASAAFERVRPWQQTYSALQMS
ncbi:MAG: amidase [Planctomycetaceae bacterium]|nr:amidase [Planctomycetaceae bacterium]